MIEQSIRDLKEAIFSEKGLNPDLLIHLAPYLTEPLLSRAISIAYAVSDPYQRALILLALAESAHLSDARKKALVDAAHEAEHEITSQPERIKVLKRILLLTTSQDRILVQAELVQEENWEADLKGRPSISSKDLEKWDLMLKGVSNSVDDFKGGGWTHYSPKAEQKGHPPPKTRKDEADVFESVASKDDGIGMSLPEQIASMGEEERRNLFRVALTRLQIRTVNTGFAPSQHADNPLDPQTPLKPGQTYCFWLDIGRPTLKSIETAPATIPDYVPPKARLVVAIFPFDGEIEITEGADVGELELQDDGTARVLHQPDPSMRAVSDVDILNRRLLFPVKSPAQEGTFRLRCNIYYEQILIQSRLIRAIVANHGLQKEGALSSEVDYTLSHTLWANHLRGFAPHRLSILLNSNGDGTHTLSFFGAKEQEPIFKNSAVIPATELKNLTENARKALWKASWGEEKPWKEGEGQTYRYLDRFSDENLSLKRLEEDLISLARRGYLLYDAIIGKFIKTHSKTNELARLMLNPGMVQIAIRDSPTQILPAALIYDYPLDTKAGSYKLCEAFSAALQSNSPLDKAPCFNGLCPHSKRDEMGNPDGYVCPSGFWGFRHILGFPTSVPDESASEIVMDDGPHMVVCVATNLDRLDGHMRALREIRTDISWHYSDKRLEIINNLKSPKSHLIYFYCHGGISTNNIPYLQVGDGTGNDFIDGSNLNAFNIEWIEPKPLVFINGCLTTALDPEMAINLVADFVRSGSAGVIGTETTIFEPLACSFAEACLGHFLKDKSSIGDAIRMARLKLLKEYNPLGLVYTPFVLPDLHVKDKS